MDNFTDEEVRDFIHDEMRVPRCEGPIAKGGTLWSMALIMMQNRRECEQIAARIRVLETTQQDIEKFLDEQSS